jgi:hypothetical protein
MAVSRHPYIRAYKNTDEVVPENIFICTKSVVLRPILTIFFLFLGVNSKSAPFFWVRNRQKISEIG